MANPFIRITKAEKIVSVLGNEVFFLGFKVLGDKKWHFQPLVLSCRGDQAYARLLPYAARLYRQLKKQGLIDNYSFKQLAM